jgi:hypothetical protein
MIGELTLLLMIIMIFCGGFVLLVEKTDVLGENYQHATINVQMLSQIRLV